MPLAKKRRACRAEAATKRTGRVKQWRVVSSKKTYFLKNLTSTKARFILDCRCMFVSTPISGENPPTHGHAMGWGAAGVTTSHGTPTCALYVSDPNGRPAEWASGCYLGPLWPVQTCLEYRQPVDWAGIRPVGERGHLATSLVSLAPATRCKLRTSMYARADSHKGITFFMLHHPRKTIPSLFSPSHRYGGKLHMHASTPRLFFVNQRILRTGRAASSVLSSRLYTLSALL